jgi:glycerophosphoryl diester phosphodiesterase
MLKFTVVAHRGDRARYPENSLLAMQSALEKGCPFIEFDLQLNTDNSFYLLHDDNFNNTAGINRSILDMKNSEVDSISVHEPKRFNDSFNPTHVPRLEEVLKLLKKFPLAKAMVEIKQSSINKWGLNKVMNLLLQQLEPFLKQCVLISFNYDALIYAQQKSDIQLGWILAKHKQTSLTKAQQLKPHYLIMNKTKARLLKMAVNTGNWLWMLYGIETTTEAQQYAQQGYHLMETDNICALMEDPQQSEACNGL